MAHAGGREVRGERRGRRVRGGRPGSRPPARPRARGARAAARRRSASRSVWRPSRRRPRPASSARASSVPDAPDPAQVRAVPIVVGRRSQPAADLDDVPRARRPGYAGSVAATDDLAAVGEQAQPSRPGRRPAATRRTRRRRPTARVPGQRRRAPVPAGTASEPQRRAAPRRCRSRQPAVAEAWRRDARRRRRPTPSSAGHEREHGRHALRRRRRSRRRTPTATHATRGTPPRDELTARRSRGRRIFSSVADPTTLRVPRSSIDANGCSSRAATIFGDRHRPDPGQRVELLRGRACSGRSGRRPRRRRRCAVAAARRRRLAPDRDVHLVAVVDACREVQLPIGDAPHRRAGRTRRRRRPRRRPATRPAAGTRRARRPRPPTSTTSSRRDRRDSGARSDRRPRPARRRSRPRRRSTGSARDISRNAPAPTTTAITTAADRDPRHRTRARDRVCRRRSRRLRVRATARRTAPRVSSSPAGRGGRVGGRRLALGALPAESTSVTNATRRDLSGAYPCRYSALAPASALRLTDRQRPAGDRGRHHVRYERGTMNVGSDACCLELRSCPDGWAQLEVTRP